jgi:uncharacterized repeat protein (TIGR03837 family)
MPDHDLPAWDIFCKVVDNYGDIGVCWRLARQLATEHRMPVRLWVDDMAPFARLCPQLDPASDLQLERGVAIRRWRTPFGEAEAADVVIESFACELPANYKAAMAARERKPAWINLEYLSAEKWVSGTHGLPSPQPLLDKYFFFLGFASGTGGLLRERGLLAQRDVFQQDAGARSSFWRSIGLSPPEPLELRISLFCYDNPATSALLEAWAAGVGPVTCIVPEGVESRALMEFFKTSGLAPNSSVSRGNLSLRVIPFLEQERYDLLLWACDFNFVRGEDSFIRAQWAARPFAWHIYPQADDAHKLKLAAFLDLYCAGLQAVVAERLRAFWDPWNGDGFVDALWPAAAAQSAQLHDHSRVWATELAKQADLASNLANFCGNLLK